MKQFEVLNSMYDSGGPMNGFMSLGQSILWAALFVYMCIEGYKLLRDGQADFITPILKIGFALILLKSIGPLNSFIYEAVFETSNKMFDRQVLGFAVNALVEFLKGMNSISTFDLAEMLTSPVGLLVAFGAFEVMVVMVIKFVVIDVLWPVMFTVVLFSGSIAVPLGVFPGVNTLRGWVLNVIEISLWPLVFTFLTTLLFKCFATQLQDLSGLHSVWDVMSAGAEAGGVIPEGTKQAFWVLIKFMAICATYGVICVFVPLIARKIVRGESAGFLGGALTAISVRMMMNIKNRATFAQTRGQIAGWAKRFGSGRVSGKFNDGMDRAAAEQRKQKAEDLNNRKAQSKA